MKNISNFFQKKKRENTKSSKKSEVFGFRRKIRYDFHDFGSECVSCSQRKATTNFGRSPFSQESDNFALDVNTKRRILLTTINEKKIEKVSPSGNNYSMIYIDYSTTNHEHRRSLCLKNH